jgi:hypothetical protein
VLISKPKGTLTFRLAPGLLVLPPFTFAGSKNAASQKDRWFGWIYGHGIWRIYNGSVASGTDPGVRSTYMIFEKDAGDTP